MTNCPKQHSIAKSVHFLIMMVMMITSVVVFLMMIVIIVVGAVMMNTGDNDGDTMRL